MVKLCFWALVALFITASKGQEDENDKQLPPLFQDVSPFLITLHEKVLITFNQTWNHCASFEQRKVLFWDDF